MLFIDAEVRIGAELVSDVVEAAGGEVPVDACFTVSCCIKLPRKRPVGLITVLFSLMSDGKLLTIRIFRSGSCDMGISSSLLPG